MNIWPLNFTPFTSCSSYVSKEHFHIVSLLKRECEVMFVITYSQTGKNVINLWHNTSSPSEEPATDFDCHLEIIESFLIPEALSKSSKLKKATYSIIHSSELPFQWTLWWISRFQNCNPVSCYFLHLPSSAMFFFWLKY